MKISLEKVRDIELIKDRDSKMLAAATMYAEEGFYVVPIRPGGKALPGKSYNFNYSHASRDPKVVSKWYGHGGKFEGWNVGLAAGKRDGIFVVDLDTHGDKDGIASFEGVIPEGFEYHGPVQFTPSGGRHLLFEWRENATSSTNKIGEGVDTRGGSESVCGGHIVAWPSEIGGVEYTWEAGGIVTETPEFVMSTMGKPWRTAIGTGRGNEFVGDDDSETKFDPAQLLVMLDCIDPNELSYNEWLEIGQAVNSQIEGQAGLDLWDEWSQKGDRYDRNECRSRWSGFDPSGQIRVGTLIHYAKQRGYELAHIEEPNRDEIDKIVSEINNTYAVVPIGSDVFVLEECVVPTELKRITPPYRIFKKQGFRSLFENKYMVAVDNNGKPVKKTYGDIWLAHEDRRTYPSGIGMFPNKPPRYEGYYNMWAGFSVEPSPGDWDLFKWHVRDIICDGDGELYEWVMDWMADLVQDPANPKGCAIVMAGIEGCGKGTFAQFIGEIFGTSFKHITDEEHLVGRFNAHMADCVVAFADEVTYGGNRKVAGKLKSLVTERYITAERKGVDAVQFYNCTHLLVASNEKWFIPAGPQSRRWLVLDVNGSKANDREYFNAIHRQMEREDGLAAMLYELQKRNITRDLKKAPETEALYEQRAQYTAMDSVVGWWSRQLATGVLAMPSLEADMTGDLWPVQITKADALNSYAEWCKEHRRRTVSDNQFFKSVKSFGFELCRFRKGSGRVYGYRVPPHETCLTIAKKECGIHFEEIKDED